MDFVLVNSVLISKFIVDSLFFVDSYINFELNNIYK